MPAPARTAAFEILLKTETGGFGAVLALPAQQQPFRAGELDLTAGPGDGRAVHFAQDGVDEAGGRCLVRAFDEFDTVGNRGVRRDALQVPQLKKGHA